jgi:hypothetical protein
MRLATGETSVYFYAWRGGPRIQAAPGTPEFISLYHQVYASLLKPKPGTLMTLIAEFKASAEFRRLSPSSVRSYLSYIRLIERDFGDLPWQRSRTVGPVGSSRVGATGLRIPREKQITPGLLFRVFFRSARIGD